MTFYEAALEVLKSQQAPLHFKRITELALEENLLSHVGRVPEQTMQARLTAMARRSETRQVVVVEPGVFALAEWGSPHDDEAAEATEPRPPDLGPPLRGNERTPLTLQESRAVRDADRSGKREAEDREARSRGRRRRRRPHQGETPVEALTALIVELGGGPIDLQYVVDAVPQASSLPEGFPDTLEGLRALADDENQRRAEAGEIPAFALEGDRIDRVVQRPPPPPPAAPRPRRRADAVAEAARSLAPALGKLAPEPVEALALALAEHLGLDDVKVAKRSAKGSPLFTGFARFGAVPLRVAVRVLVRGRDIRADDVDEVRADLEHYSAAGGIIVTPGRAERGARGRAEDMSHKPVVLVDGETLARLCVGAGIGVRVHLEEAFEADPAALAAFGPGR